MVKHEIKVELSDSTSIKEIIEKAYFEEGQMGKILGKKHYLTIDESDEINHIIFKGLNNATVKITNEIIDGSMRFMVDETEGDIRLYPISIYCIPAGDKEMKYSFY
jgi:hypothetical protein